MAVWEQINECHSRCTRVQVRGLLQNPNYFFLGMRPLLPFLELYRGFLANQKGEDLRQGLKIVPGFYKLSVAT